MKPMKRKNISVFGQFVRNLLPLLPFFGLGLCLPATAG
jgi:hypothetical protein